MTLDLANYCQPNQLFRLANGKAAKFFLRFPESPGHCTFQLIQDGLLLNYNKRGEYLGLRENPLNIEEVLPEACWSPGLGRCSVGQRLLMRDFTLGTLVKVEESKRTTDLKVSHNYHVDDGEGNISIHNHNGWCCDGGMENDVVAYFLGKLHITPLARAHITSLHGLLNKLGRSLSLDDKKDRHREFSRVVRGMELLLTKVREEIT